MRYIAVEVQGDVVYGHFDGTDFQCKVEDFLATIGGG